MCRWPRLDRQIAPLGGPTIVLLLLLCRRAANDRTEVGTRPDATVAIHEESERGGEMPEEEEGPSLPSASRSRK